MEERTNIKIENNKIIISIPFSELIFYQQERYIVEDANLMAEYIKETLLGYDEDETGATAFDRFIDEIFDYAYENAEDWLIDRYDYEEGE